MAIYSRTLPRGPRWAPFIAGLFAVACSSTDNTATNNSGSGGLGTSGSGAGSESSAAAGIGSSTGGGMQVSGAGGSSGSGGNPLDAGGAADGSDGAVPSGEVGTVAGSVRWVGRVDTTDPMSQKFSWAGVGFIAQVSVPGTTLSVALNNDDEQLFFLPVVDGKVGNRLQATKGMGTLQIPTGTGVHTVELYREHEPGGHTQFLGIIGATVLPPPRYSGRLIEVVGDENADGQWILGTATHTNNCNSIVVSCSADDLWTTGSGYLSFGAVIARSLNADWSLIGLWGATLLGTLSINSIYDDADYSTAGTAKWDFRIPASAVIVDLGNHDVALGDGGPQLKDAYKTLLSTIRSKNPNAWIFAVNPTSYAALQPTITAYITTAITELGDAKIAYVDLGLEDCTSTGCNSIPNVTEAKRIASILTPVIKEKLGW